jgi:preprotein translocase subunit SecG
MASNSGYLPLFIRPIVVAVVVVVVVLVSKSHPKPLLGI